MSTEPSTDPPTPSHDQPAPSTPDAGSGVGLDSAATAALVAAVGAGVLTVALLAGGQVPAAILAAVVLAVAVTAVVKVRSLAARLDESTRRLATLERRSAATDEALARQLRRGTSDVFEALAARTEALAADHLAQIDELERGCVDPSLLEHLYLLDRSASRLVTSMRTMRVLGRTHPPVDATVTAPCTTASIVTDVRAVVPMTVAGHVDVARIDASIGDDLGVMLTSILEKVQHLSPGRRARFDGWARDADYTFVVTADDVELSDTDRDALRAALHAGDVVATLPHPFAFSIAAVLAGRHGIVVDLAEGSSGITVTVQVPAALVSPADGGAVRTPARPFLLADGRTTPATYVDPDIQVMRTTRAPDTEPTAETQAILDLLDRPLTPLEVAEATGLPAGAAMVLIGDLVAGGQVIVHRTGTRATGVSLLEQALNSSS